MVQIFPSPKNCTKWGPLVFAKSLTQDHMYMMKIYLPLVKRKRDCFFLQGLFSQIETDQYVLEYRKLQNSWHYFFGEYVEISGTRNKKVQCLRTPGMIQLAFTEQLIPCHVHQRAKLVDFGWTEKIGKFGSTATLHIHTGQNKCRYCEKALLLLLVSLLTIHKSRILRKHSIFYAMRCDHCYFIFTLALDSSQENPGIP